MQCYEMVAGFRQLVIWFFVAAMCQMIDEEMIIPMQATLDCFFNHISHTRKTFIAILKCLVCLGWFISIAIKKDI
jgi:hypothetical protein